MHKTTQQMASMPAPTVTHKGYLDVSPRAGGASWRHPLTGTHVLIGRASTASIVLDHSTVSRLHAELVVGPFNNWWVHDLGSTNGTYVNGARVQERMLSPGDVVGVGDFVLCLQLQGPRSRLQSMAPPPPAAVEEEAPVSQAEPPLVKLATDIAEPPRINASHLSTILALGRRLTTVEDAAARLRTVCKFLIGTDFPGDSAIVVRLRAGRSVRLVSGPVHRDAIEERGRYVSSSVLDSVWESREPVLATNQPLADEHANIAKLSIPMMVRMLAVVACPLFSDDEKLDVLYVELPPAYATMEWLTLVKLVADAYQQAELGWEVRSHVRASAFVERELDMAREIQDGLVPRSLHFAGLDASIGFQPCRWVGGDYVDALPMPDGRLLLTIADVCGKGMQAALIASSLHTMVRTAIDCGVDVLQLAGRMDKHLCDYLPDHSFVTMLYIALDPRTGALECVNCGHPPPLVVGADGRLRQLQSERNTALGIVRTQLEAERSVLEANEVLLVYTDGLVELVNENQQPLGEDRLGASLSALVTSYPSENVDNTRDRLIDMLDNYRGSQLAADDCTFLVGRRQTEAY